MTDDMTTTAATKPSDGHDSVQWPDEVVARVARAMCEACGERPEHSGDCRGNEHRWEDYRQIAKAAIEAMGGERVWYTDLKEGATFVFCWRMRDEAIGAVNPAMLIPLGESDG